MSGIAQRYATALYDLADEKKLLDEVAEDLRGLKKMLAESKDLQRFVGSPLLGRSVQMSGIRAILDEAGANELTKNFAGVVAHNRRLFALGAICDRFLRELAERRGEVTAFVTSARKLDDEQMTALTDKLRGIVGNKVNVEAEVDPELLGGLIVRVGSRMVDTSIRSKLQRMGRALRASA